MTIYTNIDLASVGHAGQKTFVQLRTTKDILSKFTKEKILFIDTETCPRSFDLQSEVDAFLMRKQQEGKKITKAQEKAAVKHGESLRLDHAVDPMKNRIRLLQIGLKNGDVIVVDLFDKKVNAEKIVDGLSGKTVVGQNLKFDLKQLLYHYPGYTPGEVFDTMAAHRIVMYRERTGFAPADLATIVSYWLKRSLEKDQGGSNWGGTITPDMFRYSYMDVALLPEIYELQCEDLNGSSEYITDPPYAGVIDLVSALEMRFVEVLARIELAGVAVNIKGLRERQEVLSKELVKLQRPYAKLGINTQSSLQLVKYLAGEGIDVLGSAYEDLVPHAGDPTVAKLLRIKELQKEVDMCDDYATRAEESPDRRIHASFNQQRGAAGRMSCSSPNLQQIPRKIKALFYLTPKGRVLYRADYPAIEARIMGVIARDKTIIDIFKRKEDMHTFTGMTVLGMSEKETKETETRLVAKATNFGLMFGMGVDAFIEYAFINYGVKLEKDQATKIREAYLNTFRGIKRLHNENSRLLSEYQTIMIRTLLGRMVRCDKFTNANNYPIQGTAAEMIKLAAVIFYQRAAERGLDTSIVNIIHDEMVIEAAKKDGKKAAKILQEAMEHAANTIITEFTTEVEVKEVKAV
jgi:DNA polymerase I